MKSAKKRKPPRRNNAPRLIECIMVRMTGDQHKAMQSAADKAGLPLSSWLRAVGLVAASRSDLVKQIQQASTAE